jgi:predicted PurR-regulated permease PerM
MYPIAIVQALLGNGWQALVIFLMTAVVISTVDNVLRPRFVGRGSGLHDLIIFFATLGGIAVFGVMGFVVGPILAAITLALVDIYTLEFQPQLERTQRGPAEGLLQMVPVDVMEEPGVEPDAPS